MKALVFIPTYNEKDNIKNLIQEILKLNLDLHILVVDDESGDGTVEILDKIVRSDPRVSVIHRKGERGRGLAGREGFKYALKQDIDYLIEMDADFSHHPRYIPQFLQAITDCDVVIGSRWIKGGSVCGRPWQRDYFSGLAQFFCRFILGLDIRDGTSGYRCFKKDVLEKIDLDNFLSKGPSIVEEVNYHLQKKGFKVKEIPIIFYQRRQGSSKLNIAKLLETFYTLIMVRLSA
jgi:dolichol-phosphate mannosyltransferase